MAKAAKGTKLKIGANVITGLKSIGGIEESADTIDVTTLDSADGYKEFISSYIDAGEVSFSGNFEPGDTTGQVALRTLLQSGTVTAFSILFPSSLGAEWTFNGIVTGFKTNADQGDAAAFEGTIKVTGKPNLGTTASGGLTALALTGTGGTISPVFANTTYSYAYNGVTGASVTVTATAAAHTLRLYVDGTYLEDLTTAVASSAIALTLNVGKKLTILAFEAGKTTKIYEIVAIKTA